MRWAGVLGCRIPLLLQDGRPARLRGHQALQSGIAYAMAMEARPAPVMRRAELFPQPPW